MEEIYSTMRAIGKLLGLSSHQVGRRLKQLGLRTDEGRPSQVAFDKGYVEPKWTADGQRYLWAWHQAKTLSILKSLGIELATDKPPDGPC